MATYDLETRFEKRYETDGDSMSRVTASGSEYNIADPAYDQIELLDDFSKPANIGSTQKKNTANWSAHSILTHIRKAYASNTRTDPVLDNMRIALAKNQLYSAKKLEQIVAAVRSAGLTPISDRLDYLCKLPADDLPDKPIGLESLRKFAVFIMKVLPPCPLISISPDGFVNAEWDMPESSLALGFLPSGDIRFSVIHRTSCRNASGKLPYDDAMRVIQPFMDRLMQNDG